ncbi:hypothetical protein [Paenibacillus silviterrae]|uniref:hypothetical protein n=1 Tax=Paenibacillus silviterrae TaxID=3242194 RepID=UPI0025436D35|nr:hypothetical protein [Paenibacillus chinjuensis]
MYQNRRAVVDYRKIKERLKQEQEEQQLDISEICFDDYNATHFARSWGWTDTLW